MLKRRVFVGCFSPYTNGMGSFSDVVCGARFFGFCAQYATRASSPVSLFQGRGYQVVFGSNEKIAYALD